MPALHIERILLVAGAPDAGKSTQLRSMFLDPRMGTGGKIPSSTNVLDTYSLSPARRLYLRLTSPHERKETLDDFVHKISAKTSSGRWCVASAIQVDADRRMPDLAAVVQALLKRFDPEHVRIALLSPDRHGTVLPHSAALFDALWMFDGCEPFCIDARSRTSNGLLLADTFDFA